MGGRGVEARLDFAIAVQEHLVAGGGLLEELLDEEEFRAVDDGVDDLRKGLHGG